MSQGIRDIQYYVPAARLRNDELISELGFDESFLRDKLGIEERRICSPSEACSDLAFMASKKVLESAALNDKDVGLLILCTQNPDYKLPATSHILQDRLGLSTGCAAFDLNLGCSGFVYGLGIAKAFMEVHRIRNALLVTSDPYSKIIARKDRVTRPLFGDGAAATLLSEGASCQILESTFGSDGSGAKHLMVSGGGTRHPHGEGPGAAQEHSPHLFMDGREIFNFMMRRVPEDVSLCLRKNNLNLSDIDYFVFHQASKYMLDSLVKRMGLDPAKVIYFLKDVGNTVSSSIPIALSLFFGDKKLTGKKVLLCGFGVGLSWASTVLNFE
jgi:3-oxoacyl-[acyl-carrier-protein] synthase-3